jgi:predicted HD phosphohydrolase
VVVTVSGVAGRVLLVSIDGLAPRAITRLTMPNLCALARSGAGCFTARTVEPPITVPAHASMLRGVPTEVHGLVDNARAPSAAGTRSVFSVAAEAGRRTASVVCWPPLDDLIEPGASHVRISTDSGYDPADDDRTVEQAIALVAGRDQTSGGPVPELVFAYLVACDLAGHAHGWDSPGYAAAVARTDVLVGDLVSATPADVAIVVTTDHGGIGRHHGAPVPDTMTTFVVARSGRIAPASTWEHASVLDVAPTVADLLDVEPDPSWVGVSLLGRELPLVDHVVGLLAAMAEHSYGERIDMLSHALQAAACAGRDGADESLVLAALLHDVGHLLGHAGEWGAPDHAEVGARWLQPWLSPDIVEPVRLHVAAKRYLVATDPAYRAMLSEASVATLAQQGGPHSPDEAARFVASPHAAGAVALRRWDDAGKEVGLDVRPLDHYRRRIEAALGG